VTVASSIICNLDSPHTHFKLPTNQPPNSEALQSPSRSPSMHGDFLGCIITTLLRVYADLECP